MGALRRGTSGPALEGALLALAFARAGETLRQLKSVCSLIGVADWPDSGWQVDEAFPDYLPLPPELSRQKHLGDSIMTAVVLAPFAPAPTRFTDLGRLRLQECERVAALRTELGKCGAQVREEGDTLVVFPGPLHGAEVETYNDHRLAMCFATLGLKVPGISIKNPACVKKTFPSFFQKLAAAPPGGLGAEVRDARTDRPLGLAELFAD
jgi:3-phosphoshikimate 1-carboxyvinyltransferase